MDTNPSLWGFIELVSQLFNIPEPVAAFWVGIGVMLLLAVLGRIFRIGQWNATRGAVYAPMQATTSKTPYQVVSAGRVATVKLFLTWLFFFVLAGVGLYFYANQRGEAQWFTQMVDNLVRSLLSP